MTSNVPVLEGLNEAFCLFEVTARLAVWSVVIAVRNQTSFSRPSGKSYRGPLLIKAPATYTNRSPRGFATAAAAQLLSFLPKNARAAMRLTVILCDQDKGIH